MTTLINILLRLAPFFFIFSAGTNAHYVNSAVMTGKANYQATGRGFVIAHVRSRQTENTENLDKGRADRCRRNVLYVGVR